MDDKEIIRLFWEREQDAVSETANKYGDRLYKLSWNLLYNREDAEESVSDTYLQAWNTIPPKKPMYLFAYLAKICRFISYGKLDMRNAAKRKAEIVELTHEMEECIPCASQDTDSEELGRVLNAFIGTLSEEKRLMFLRRYWYEDSISEIALRYGMSESKVKVTLHRVRKELKEFMLKEGVAL